MRNEIDRYLVPCIDHLLAFCDLVAVLDDCSTDGSYEWLRSRRGVEVVRTLGPNFFKHEGQARQRLLEFTFEQRPTHVVALDADELASEGAAIRAACETTHDVFSLPMLEVWKAQPDCLCVRGDGGWRPHATGALWRVPADTARLRIADRALACGRVPTVVDQARATPIDAQLWHFGWANETERVARHRRYAVADGGRYHASQHLDSILWPDDRVAMHGYDWPESLLPYRQQILERTMRGAPVA